MKDNLIEDESKDKYTIRCDKLKDGESIQCRDDPDMHVTKSGQSVILVKNCFVKQPFSK